MFSLRETSSLYDTDGDGLIEVHNVKQLNAIRYDLDGDGNIGSGVEAYKDAFHGVRPPSNVNYRGYELAADLDFAGSVWALRVSGSPPFQVVLNGWNPIGTSGTQYTALFEGNGYTITGLYINRLNTDNVGLFGVVKDGVIRNVGLEKVEVTASNYVGSLVGWNEGTITDSYAIGRVKGENDVGGLVGDNGGTITSSFARVTVLPRVSAENRFRAGGLAGRNGGSIMASYAMGDVSGGHQVGGLVGWNTGDITSSYAVGTVTGRDNHAGGLVGQNSGIIMGSYATGDVVGYVVIIVDDDGVEVDAYIVSDNTGGLVGYNFNGTITSSYAMGDVDGGGGVGVGGLVGRNEVNSSITSSYATGDVSGDSDVGGLVGINVGGTITASYYSSAAIVTQGGAAVEPDPDQAKSLMELLSVPTADDPGIFGDWAADAAGKKEDSDGNAYTLDDKRIVWDFGTRAQYPVLCPVDADEDGNFTSAEFGMQPRDIEGAYVYFSQPEFTVGEEDGAVAVSVVMLNAPTSAVMLTVLCSDDTAKSPGDYMRGSGAVTLSFDASSAVDSLTTATFTISIIDDNELELDETIALSFDELPDDVELVRSRTATVLILDDDARSAYDTDNDGLIEVHTVEQLNAIRCDLNGDGKIDDTTSANPNIGGSKAAAYVDAFHGVFPFEEVTYRGYELAADLDFADTRWALRATADGILNAVVEGWEPIGDESNRYLSTFNGDGHTITGLCIYRPDTDQVGLFGAIGDQSRRGHAFICNVGLEEVYVHGANSVGGLVGTNTIATITSSYATGTVMGSGDVGGLVGRNYSAIIASYASGAVTGTDRYVGGLAGRNEVNGSITSSYATGAVTGDRDVGGLVGLADGSSTINSSYYSSAAVVLRRGAPVPPNDYARSVVELARVPTVASLGIFEGWAVDARGTAYTIDDGRIVWNFGTNAQYPVLCPVDTNGDTHFTSIEFGKQPRDVEGAYVYFSQPEFVVGEEDGAVEVSVVTLNAPTNAVMVTVEYSDGTALSPDDYMRGSGAATLSFDASSAVDFLTTVIFTITIHADEDLEADETIALSLDVDTLPPGVALAAPSTATVLILDDESRDSYDTDNDGLIEVYTVEQFNVIRYDCNGDGEIDDLTSNDMSDKVSKAAMYVSAFGYGICPSDRVTYQGYELAADLDFAGSRWMRNATGVGIPDAVAGGWEPIGNDGTQYTALLEGNGHTITGLYIYRPYTNDIGLFGVTGAGAIIRNVSLKEVEVRGNNFTGSLVGKNNVNAIVTSSCATGDVSGDSHAVGGLVGLNDGTIRASYATGTVRGSNRVGGLVGWSSGGTITSSYATGTVTGDRDYVGGLVGDNFGTITSSYSTGDGDGRYRVGGLVGANIDKITSSYSTGNVSGASDVGGFVGSDIGRIESSYYSSTAVVLRNGEPISPNAYARSLVELARVPTADAPGIFKSWALDAAGKKEDSDDTAYTLDDKRIVWDFGTNAQYPMLCPVDADEDGYFTSAEFGTQSRNIAGTYVYFSQPEFTVGEADGTVAVSVVMLNAPTNAVMITVKCSDGTALSPGDYMRGTGTVRLSFDSASAVDLLTTATFSTPIIDDSLLEEDETIALSFDNLPNRVVEAVPSAATVVILDGELRSAYDADGDGLIEVHDTEQLSVIRCDLDGDGEIDDTTSNDPAVDGSKASIYVRAFGYGFCPPDNVSYVGYELAADLDFAGTRWMRGATATGISGAVLEGWAPIISLSRPFTKRYTAIFEGNGHTITGLYINRPATDYVGLFGATKAGAIIRNVSLKDVSVRGGEVVGGLVGNNVGTITSSYVTGTVMGTQYVGGLVGDNNAAIVSSYTAVTVKGDVGVGGLAGTNGITGTITSSYSTGTVIGREWVGGLLGHNFGHITSKLCDRRCAW